MHRTYEGTNEPVRLTWYSDRIEIVFLGGPYGVVTRTSFGAPGITEYRNPTLAEAMRALGCVQRFGAGLQIAAHSLAQTGILPPNREETSRCPTTKVGVRGWTLKP
jgi:ATP-dependent DNA helicase RecG